MYKWFLNINIAIVFTIISKLVNFVFAKYLGAFCCEYYLSMNKEHHTYSKYCKVFHYIEVQKYMHQEFPLNCFFKLRVQK